MIKLSTLKRLDTKEKIKIFKRPVKIPRPPQVPVTPIPGQQSMNRKGVAQVVDACAGVLAVMDPTLAQ